MRRPAKAVPQAAVAGGEAAAPAPTFHLDLAEISNGRCIVVGWLVRKPTDELDLFAQNGTRRIAPVVTFQRPDVIEYFAYTRSTTVDRFDIAYGFVFCFEARSFDGLSLSLQGFAEVLRAHSRPADDDGSFLARYLEAMQPLGASPAVEAARARFQQKLMPAVKSDATAAVEAVDGAAQISLPTMLAACETAGPAFAPGAVLEGRLAVLAIHQRGRHLTHSHRAMLAALEACGYRTVLVNSNPEAEAGRDVLAQGRIAGLLRRPDHGRDIASWLLALALLEGRTDAVDHVLFCNDSFLGPFDDLTGLMARRAPADFWALTDSWEHGYHLQSSFFTLSAAALAGEAFRHFAATYAYPNERDAVVTQGELGLSRRLVDDGGLSIAVLAPYSQLASQCLAEAPLLLDALRALPEHRDALPVEIGHFDRPQRGYVDGAMAWTTKFLADLRHGIPRNPQHVFWEALLVRHRVPFVKKELLFSNPSGVPGFYRLLPAIAASYGAEVARWVEADMRRGGRRAPAL